MNIYIDNKCGKPIYNQIYSQLKSLIISEKLKEDDRLPSIRTLAKDLHISVITTKRAYEELEREGFLYAIASKGFFVAPKNTQMLQEEYLQKIEGHLDEVNKLSKILGISKPQIIEMIDILWEEEK